MIARMLALMLLLGPPAGYSGGPYAYWWPLSEAKKEIAELAAAGVAESGKYGDGTKLDWPPAAVEIRMCSGWGGYVHVGGKTDFRELGCRRQYHATMSCADSVVCTLVFTSIADSTGGVKESSTTDFRLERIEDGVSDLARRARELYKSMPCLPKEPFVLLRASPSGSVYTYLNCNGELVTTPADQ